MTKILIALTIFITSAESISAKDTATVRFTDRSNMELQMRGSFVTEMPRGSDASARFRMDNFRWNIDGTAGKNIYYHFRQSFNAFFDTNFFENLLASVNYAYVTWKPFSKVSFTAGKNVFALGGHEFWAAPVHVIEFSDFGGSLSAYQMGLSTTWNISDTQEMIFQISNIKGGKDEEYYYGGLPEGISPTGAPFLYTVNWNGCFLDDSLELRYSASYGQQAKNKSMSIFTLGQSYRREKWGAYLDLLYSRQGLDANGLISSTASFADGMPRTMQNVEYFSAIAYLHFFISPSFDVFFKGIGETGGLYKNDRDASGGLHRFNWNAQACLEYMPTQNHDFRLFAHYSYYSRHSTDYGASIGIDALARQTVSAGIIYIMHVF